MTWLPPRRPKQRSRIERSPKRDWPRHRRWVKSHGCCVPGCLVTPVDFAHLRSAANAGKGQKPHDIFGISLCRPHHDEQHRIGQTAFDRKYAIDSWALAAEFTRKSADTAMREALRLVTVEEMV